MRFNHKGIVDPVTLYLIAALGGGIILGSWKPLRFFKHKPDTKQLTELQAKQSSDNAAREKAQKEKDEALAADAAKLKQQVKAALSDNSGAEIALGKAANPSPEVLLGLRMVNRANIKLGLAVGKLSTEEQREMLELIEQLLSGKQAEIDAANAKLAELDARNKLVTEERNQLQKQIPVLVKKAEEAETTAKATQEKVVIATNVVKAQADKLYAATQENGSLWGSIKKAVFTLLGLAVFFQFILPGIIKHLEAGWLKTSLRNVAGYTTAPLLFHDATKKIPNTNAASPEPLA